MLQLYRWLIVFLLTLFAGNLIALETSVELPDSLGKWYKPQNKRQVWLHTMFGMRRELQALQEYSEQGDMQGVEKWTGKLLKHYRSLPEMVPEWSKEVELDTANDLQAAVSHDDLAKIKTATRKLANSCKGCHSDYQLLARLRYRTADFSQLQIMQDGRPVKFTHFKKDLVKTLNRIKISAVDGYWKKAEISQQQLERKLNAFGEICSKCHKDSPPKERILGTQTAKDLTRLKQAIQSRDLKLTGRSLGTTAVNICARCHGVHRSLSEIRAQLF